MVRRYRETPPSAGHYDSRPEELECHTIPRRGSSISFQGDFVGEALVAEIKFYRHKARLNDVKADLEKMNALVERHRTEGTRLEGTMVVVTRDSHHLPALEGADTAASRRRQVRRSEWICRIAMIVRQRVREVRSHGDCRSDAA